jgi:hypothetical protein
VSTAERIAPQQIGGFRRCRDAGLRGPATDGDNRSVQVSRAAGSTRWMRAAMTKEERRELEAALARLRQEHRDLDAAIDALHSSPGSDILQVQRLKKRKLQLKDKMTFIEDQLFPDIIA